MNLSDASANDLAELESGSPHAVNLARNIRDWLEGAEHAPAAAIASARLLESNANAERAFADRIAAAAGAARATSAGKALAVSEVAHARVFAECFDRLTLAIHDRDSGRVGANLSDMAAQAAGLAELLASSKAAHATCAESLRRADQRAADMENRYRAEAVGRNRLQMDSESAVAELQARNDSQAAAILALQDQRAALESDVAELLSVRDLTRERAAEAERQLAEYRALMAALPLGMAGAYPAALPLLRAYLADRESGKVRRYSVDGHESANLDAPLSGDGRFAPYYVFDMDEQSHLPIPYPDRAAAERVAAAMESGK